MLQFIVRITNIDHDGFQGREMHPDDSMVGLEATIHKMVSYVVEDGRENEFMSDSEDQNHAMGYTVLTGITESGDAVQLMSHEVEFVRPYTVEF